MSLLDLLKNAQNGGLDRLGAQLGLDAGTTRSLAEQFAPAISGGMKQRATQEGGLGAVLGALKGEDRASFFDDPATAAAPDAQAKGAEFLGQIFGSQQAAPDLAAAAAERAGAPVDKAQQLLPALAAMLQGGLQKRAPDTEVSAAMAGLQQSGDGAGMGLGDLLGGLGGGSSSGAGGLVSGLMGALGGSRAGGGDGLGGLLQMLDADGDGSPLDDIVGRFLR